ncbi:unnamed protein product [Polarella glacialis]|uniref:EF-hand domain-containing protein n=1 Tax=Polarella glacialis TaxID=89957 RepID=A0A813DXJ1_POLGL|nr:unnamed protein product [Polarella glacialis]CAE8637672.1 unnamed protein product [Polarella glacialis]
MKTPQEVETVYPASIPGCVLHVEMDVGEKVLGDEAEKEVLLQVTNIFGFQDRDTIKQEIRSRILQQKPPYRVYDYYHETGFWRGVATSAIFENATLVVIAINALWIAIDTDWNTADDLMEADSVDISCFRVSIVHSVCPVLGVSHACQCQAHPVFQVAEHAFCIYFSCEWIVRFMSFKRKFNSLKDPWFVFDSFLVATMVVETWGIPILKAATGLSGNIGPTAVLRLLRLLRLSRLVRMLRSLPELMILVKGMVTAMKSVVYVFGLLAIITYIYGIALTQLSAGFEFHDLYFTSVGVSMYSLLIYATFLDNLADFCDAIRAESLPCLFIVFTFVGLAAMTMMNMLIGVLCEVVSSVAAAENEERMTVTVVEKMREVLAAVDADNNGSISYKEFLLICHQPAALQALKEVGIDPVGMIDFAETLFIQDGVAIEMTFEKFMGMLLDLRESNCARVKDIMNLYNQIQPEMKAAQKDMQEIKDRTATMEEACIDMLIEIRKLAREEVYK